MAHRSRHRVEDGIAVDATLAMPLYQQLRDSLRSMIAQGVWKENEAIWSERELMRRAGVSRMTVRQAIAELTHEGLLRSAHGRGTFVASPRISQVVAGVYSFTEGIQAQGRNPQTKVLSFACATATAEQAAILALDPAEQLFRIERLRLVDGLPTMLDIVHLPARLCPTLTSADLTGSLYVTLREVFGLPALRSTDTIEAVAAQGVVADALGVPKGSPVTLMRRLALTTDDVPFELTEEYARPDRCRYRISLVAEPPTIEMRAPDAHADSMSSF